MFSIRVRAWLAVIVGAATFSQASLAFQVLPRISDVDRQLAGLGSNGLIDWVGMWFIDNAIPMVKNPVHEAITLRALVCDLPAGREKGCVTVASVKAHQALLYGVRWPDDPPFSLNRANPPRVSSCDARVTLRSTAQPNCWKTLFFDADKLAKQKVAKAKSQPAFGPGDYILYRSHFGDLQFFHSMAAYDGERAFQTKQRMKMWAQFLWGIGTRTTPTDQYLRTLGIEGLDIYFPGDMTAINLLATGIVEVRKDLNQVAIGALLHMVQDSFSQAHTSRDDETGASCPGMPGYPQPGRINQFYSYAGQIGHMHDEEDTFGALGLQTVQRSPSVVDVSKVFLTLWRNGASWPEAETYFDCVFTLANEQAEASAGPFVE
jgi:hypothetical protein